MNKEDARKLLPELITAEMILSTARYLATLEEVLDKRELDSIAPEEERLFKKMFIGAGLIARNVPAILNPARIIALGDKAAENPSWWKANRLHFFCPEMTYREIGELLALTPRQVRDAVKNVEISESIYENLPPIKEKLI